MKVVIFCGGFGTRMWPASRKSYPKQFYPLIGGKSFFRHTVDRFEKAFEPKDIIVSTEARYLDFVHKIAPEIPKENVIGEPERRDNLAAIGLAVAILHKRFPNEVVFFSWCDHLIKYEERFLKLVKLASKISLETGHPVSLDQRPLYPSVHLGWLKIGKEREKANGHRVYEIEKHIEKPNIHKARKFFKSDQYLLHTGYGAWRSDTLMNYYQKYAKKAFVHLDAIASTWGEQNYETVLKKEYAKIEKNSIEYGLFEKIPSHERYTIPMDVGWQDAGTWQLMYESLAREEDANLVEGEADTHFIDASGNLVVGPKNKLISIIGVSNIVVVDTPTGLLVCSLDKTKDVKELFAILEKNKPQYVE